MDAPSANHGAIRAPVRHMIAKDSQVNVLMALASLSVHSNGVSYMFSCCDCATTLRRPVPMVHPIVFQ